VEHENSLIRAVILVWNIIRSFKGKGPKIFTSSAVVFLHTSLQALGWLNA
jgi:hypothetical protein